MSPSFLYNLNNKTAIQKQAILRSCIVNVSCNIADLSQELGTSIPTTTKLIAELIDEGFLETKGKIDTNGGRRPSIYGLNPDAGYFVGVDVSSTSLSMALMNFQGTIIDYEPDINFTLEATKESLDTFCAHLKKRLAGLKIKEEKILAYGINLTGRVNKITGYSYSYYLGEDKPITDYLSERLDAPVYIDNDSRAMAYGEYMGGICKGEKDMLYINISMGLGMGMISDGRLIYGKCGFSGEIGHFPLLSNEKICRCGKIGCLETGASGYALLDSFNHKLESGRVSILSSKYEKKQKIEVEDILDAIKSDDVLAIECIEEIGQTLGRAIAGLINIFNPELVVIGGKLSEVKDYLMIPLVGAINKYTLTLVCRDTKIKCSKLGVKAGPLGACLLTRSKLLGLI